MNQFLKLSGLDLDELIVEIVTNWATVQQVRIGVWLTEEYEDDNRETQYIDTFYAEAWGLQPMDGGGSELVEATAVHGATNVYDATMELWWKLERKLMKRKNTGNGIFEQMRVIDESGVDVMDYAATMRAASEMEKYILFQKMIPMFVSEYVNKLVIPYREWLRTQVAVEYLESQQNVGDV